MNVCGTGIFLVRNKTHTGIHVRTHADETTKKNACVFVAAAAARAEIKQPNTYAYGRLLVCVCIFGMCDLPHHLAEMSELLGTIHPQQQYLNPFCTFNFRIGMCAHTGSRNTHTHMHTIIITQKNVVVG